MADVEAGRLHVEVVGDLTGFARELQRRIDVATRDLVAKVAVRVDSSGLRRELNRATREAAAGQTIDVKARVAGERLRDELGRFVSDAEARTRAAQVGVTVDGRRVRGDVSRLVRELEAEQSVDLPADVDLVAARGRMAGFRAREERDAIEVPVVPDARQARQAFARAGGGLSKLLGGLKVPAVAGGLNLVTTAAASLAAGAVALTGALSPVVGLLGALPGLAVAAASGLGAVLLATSGLGDAVGALVERQRGGSAAARSAATAARAQEAATERVSRAQASLADTVERAADRQRDAARAVRDAELRLADAHREAARAQQDVNRAREEARERLQDLRLELAGAALDEEAAQLALQRALLERDEVERNLTATMLERNEADLAVRQAEQRLAEIRERNIDLAAEAADAERKGVDGSDEVVAARERQVEAQRAVGESLEALADAQREQSRAQRDAARDVADAQRELADALSDLGEAGGGGLDKVADKLAALSPAGRRFAAVVAGYLPLFDRVRAAAGEGLFPLLERALHRVATLGPLIERAMFDAGRAVGQVAARGADMVAAGPFSRDLGVILAQNSRLITGFGGVALTLLDALRHVAVAAQPLLERLVAGATRLAERLRDAAAAGRESGGLVAFFDRAADVGAQLARIVGNVAVGLARLAGAGSDLGGDMLDSLERLTARFAAFTGSVAGRNTLVQYFADARPVLEATARLIGDVLTALASRAASPALAPVIDQIRTELLPALIDLADSVSQRLGPTLVNLATAWARFSNVLSFSPLLTVANAMAELTIAVSELISRVPGMSTFVASLLAMSVAMRGVAVAGKLTGLTAFINTVQGRGTGAVARFVAGIRGADKANATFAGRLGQRVVPALRQMMTGLRSAGAAAAGMAVSVARSTAAWLANAVATARATVVMLAQRAASIAATVATVAMTAAQAALNLVLSLNPIGAVILAVTALVAAIVLAYRNSETFRNIVNGAFGTLMRVVGAALGFVRRYWPVILTVLTGPIGLAVSLIVRHFNTIRSVVSSVAGFVTRVWNGVRAALEVVGNGIREALTRPVEAVVTVIRGQVNLLLDAVRFVLRAIGRIRITLPSIPGVDIPGIPDGMTIGLPDLSGLIPSLADGAIVRSRRGGTVVRVAEAGKDEIIGPLDAVAEAVGGPRIVIQQTVNNPRPETPSESAIKTLRWATVAGINESRPSGAGYRR